VSAGSASTNAGITSSAQGTGLQIVAFGTKVVGGDSSSCFNDERSGATTGPVANKNADSSPSLCDQKSALYAASEGTGTLAGSSGVNEDQKASESSVGAVDGKTTPTCAQGGSTPSGTPGSLSLGVSCAFAEAAVSATGDPAASSMGEVANLTIGLDGVLSPLLGASPSSGTKDSCESSATVGVLLNTLCTALSSLASTAPPADDPAAGINQALQNIYDVVTKGSDPTVTIDVGQAKTSVSATGNTSVATAQGSTLDIAIFPGAGCAAPQGAASQPTVAQCTSDEASAHPQYSAPLVEILVSPAHSTSTYDGTSWASTGSGSLATVDVNIPGAQQVTSVGQNVDQTFLAGTPLQTTIDLGSAQVNHSSTGATATAQGAEVEVLESGSFPGGGSGQGAISADLGSASASGTQAGAPSPPVSTAASGGSAAPAAKAATAASASPTSVHTGEWWSGSMPLLVVLVMLGGGLLGWPRLRRISSVSRILSGGRR